ncbi:ABC-2 type transport system permease protein [Micromonospora pisi]|uniref:ABC-2 type transport system permease protein n=1 Tax=Micromonospora pisi TaxID=589240 RepID=A0A495JBR2_9ACTN|nr:anibiotic ABC transporter [Micromonospora pisi]RKR86355.1 ABC-2 type transport system permease protein [Micromonospora pisi]
MSAFTATGRLTRLALRRDRLQLPVWILSTTLLAAFSISATNEQYPTDADRIAILRTAVDTPALLMFRAAPTGASSGAMAMFQILAFLAVLAAFMSTLAVVRHTRQNEETGRTEMIGATVVGRLAGLTAALLVTVIANAVLAVLLALTLVGYGEPAPGAVAAGLAVGAAGLVFAAVAAVAAQITQTARGANGIAAAAIGAAYLLRGLGDAFGEVQPAGYTITSAWPSWLSPIGWTSQVRPFTGDRWWVLGLSLVFLVAGVGAAFVLTTHRDVGQGLIAARPGPATAAPTLLSPLGLAWRLQRGTLLGWAVTVTVLSLAIGSIGNAVEQGFADNERAAETIGSLSGADGAGSLVDSFMAAMMAIIGAMVAGYLVQALLRLRTEEASGRAEAVLATATSRSRWLGSHLFVVVAGALALLGLAGLSVGLVYGASTGRVGEQVVDLSRAALVQLPSALILAGFAVAAFGLVPRLAVGLGWLGFTLSLVLGQLGGLLGLPEAVRDISPFSHVPALPAAEAAVTPLLVMSAVALALAVAGLVLFRRRNLAT